MNIFICFLSLALGENRGPRPNNVTLHISNSSDYEIDLAGTLMDIFDNRQVDDGLDSGDKIRVLSNIIRIELDDTTDHASTSIMNENSHQKNNTACTSRVVYLSPYSNIRFILTILTFILGLITFIVSLVLLHKSQLENRRNVYLRAEQPYPEQVSLTSSRE